MKKTKAMILVLMILVSFPQMVHGKEVNSNQKETPFSIQILEGDLSISEIKIPQFGDHLTVSKNKQILVPESDFVIQVRDKRTNRKNPWAIMYHLTLFKNEKSEELVTQHLSMKKGKFTVDGEEVSPESYQANEIEITGEGQAQLANTIQENAGETYEYRVKNKDIELELQESIPAGTYTATQTVTIVNSAVTD